MPRFVYILASRPHGAIYIGSATDLRRRVSHHQSGAVKAHTRRYGIHTLVWFEHHADPAEARLREHRLKRWRRAWKEALIAEYNPQWQDITAHIPD
ncbi:GIY-YIG nuclease family protein [Pseudooceanicola sp.]|uniref:GIY-YIG nuclease family protein n=1 Tax=Pseudooceanicola sp. TaxID=1914328 RepID=UPI0035C7020B